MSRDQWLNMLELLDFPCRQVVKVQIGQVGGHVLRRIVAFHPFKQAGVITHENVTMTSSQTKTQKLLLDKDHISQQKINATSVSIILWIKDQILIGIYGQIDVDVLFRNVSKTSGDVGSAGGWHGSLENQADAYVACTVGKSQSWTVGPLNECYNWELPKSHTKNTEIVQHVT